MLTSLFNHDWTKGLNQRRLTWQFLWFNHQPQSENIGYNILLYEIFCMQKCVYGNLYYYITSVCVWKQNMKVYQVSSSTKEGNHAKIIDDILQQWEINKW